MIQEFNDAEMPFVQRAEHYCAGDEQCISSVRTKLMTWGADRLLIERILQYLVREDYINEQRYAIAYCQTKMRNQKWGRITFLSAAQQIAASRRGGRRRDLHR